MSEGKGSSDLQHLMPPEEETTRLIPSTSDVSPPLSPNLGKIMSITPASPTSNNVSSSGAGSVHGTGSHSSKKLGQNMTLSSAANTKFLYVSEKFSGGSRRPSLLSELGCRTPRETKPPTRIKEVKKETDTIPVAVDNQWCLPVEPTSAPPNTPSPSAMMMTNNSPVSGDGSMRSSEDSSQMTTMALASDSDEMQESDSSSQTLKKPLTEFYKRPNLTLDKSITSSGYVSPSDTLKFNYPTIKSSASKNFLKSYWTQKCNQKNVQHHCFLTDVTDVRRMEEALLHLLEDFHSGKLRAFAKDYSMEQMQGIREQQEKLAKQHFDFGAQQELYAPLSEDGLRVNQESMKKLFSSLEQLSISIEKLHSFSRDSSEQ